MLGWLGNRSSATRCVPPLLCIVCVFVHVSLRMQICTKFTTARDRSLPRNLWLLQQITIKNVLQAGISALHRFRNKVFNRDLLYEFCSPRNRNDWPQRMAKTWAGIMCEALIRTKQVSISIAQVLADSGGRKNGKRTHRSGVSLF